MNTKSIVTLILAGLLIIGILGLSALLTYTGAVNRTKFNAQQIWAANFSLTQSMKAMRLGKQKAVVAQNESYLTAFDSQGKAIFESVFSPPIASTFTDMNGDGSDEAIVAQPFDGATSLFVLDDQGNRAQELKVPEFTQQPARIAAIHFPDGLQIIVGGDKGQLVSLNPSGQELWRVDMMVNSKTDAIRGLDDIKIDGKIYLAAADHNGQLAVYDSAGKAMWEYNMEQDLRRMRAFDLKGNGKGQVVAGGDNGRLLLIQAADGKVLQDRSLGQAITEIRDAEVDGEPSSREFVVGGKQGGVWAYNANGEPLWSHSVSEKVTEITGVDVDDDGAQEVIIGDDAGAVTIFSGKSGDSHPLFTLSSGVARIDDAKLTESDQIVIADNSSIHLYSLKKQTAPIWYNPMIAGVLLSLIIAVVAWFVATAPPRPVEKLEIVDQSVEGLQARRRMLHASIADVERLKQSGEMAPESYMSRIKELRGDLADTEAALSKSGTQIKVETSKCPNCGGVIPLGTDRCEYCGQVVIA